VWGRRHDYWWLVSYLSQRKYATGMLFT